jgi:micrococcal nuclease
LKKESEGFQKTGSKISGKINSKSPLIYITTKISSLTLAFTQVFIFLSIFFLVSCGLFYYDKSGPEESLPGTLSKGTGEDPQIDDDVFYKVKEIVDGDTFTIENGNKIRLIGINTPEYGMYFYEEAKDVLALIIKGKKVLIERDISDIDRYGRLLRYAYYGQLFVNLEMVIRGFANSFTYPPDVKYQEKFIEAEKYARANNLGLWAISAYSGPEIDIKLNPDADGKDTENINGEFVTIRNNGKKDLNIGGWTIKDSSTSIYEFYGYILRQQSSLTLYSGKGKDGNGRLYWGSDVPVWNNEHDSFYLRDKDGLLVKYLAY